jgi:fucose permease
MTMSLAGALKTRQTVWTRLTWASYLLNGFAAVLGGAVLPQVIQDFRLNPFFGGLFIALPAIGIILAGLAGGLLSGVFGIKRLMIFSLLLMAGCLLTISLAPVLSVLLIGALAFGLANGMIETGGNSIIAELFPGRAARELNRLHLIYGIGAFISPLMVAFFSSRGMPWTVSYWLVALLLVSLCLIVLTQPGLPHTYVKKLDFTKLRAMFLQPIILQVWIGAILLLATEQGFTGWVTAYLQDINILPVELASLGLAIFWLLVLLGRYLNTRLPITLSQRAVILTEISGAAAAVFVILVSRNITISLVTVACFGLFMAGLYPNLLAFGSDYFPGEASLVSGIFVTGVGFGKLIGPAIIGATATRTGIPAAMYLSLILLLCLAVLLSLKLKVRQTVKINGTPDKQENHLGRR